MRMQRIFIADADQDVRVSLQMLLDREAGMRVVGIAVRSNGLVGQVSCTTRCHPPGLAACKLGTC